MQSLTRTLCASALAIAALAAAAGAQAQSSGSTMSWYSPGAGYIGFNAGRSDYSLNSGVGFPFDKHDTVYNLYGGSYFTSNLGLELGYTNFGKVSRAGGQTKAEGFNLSLVGKLPLSSQFNLLGKLGTTYGRTDVSAVPASGIASGSESGFGVSYGLGAEYAFNPQLSAVLQYDSHDLKFVNSGRDRVGATTVGLRYRF
ncbi:outer membrane beta-barrel protein [Polaromonas jejuensis]|uniref:Outer membrane beta-barrel protein n=1 Tax=Polaromonas jejuensis TaxID=457502 RepID=A0ABW0Q7A9_9BURK|nr:outer membrane beta-barrel protein [Polaromonas jejuensis]